MVRPKHTGKSQAGGNGTKPKSNAANNKQNKKTNPDPVHSKGKPAKASPYTDKWLSALRRAQSNGLRDVPAMGEMARSATKVFTWTRILTTDDACRRSEFEVAKQDGFNTPVPCGYGVAIDITGYDEYLDPDGGASKFRIASSQIYHVDSAQIMGSSDSYRVSFWAGVPAIQQTLGTDRYVVVAPTQRTVYPDCSPSYSGIMSFGHMIQSDERRVMFYKHYGGGRFRKYLQLGVYSPTYAGDSGSKQVGTIDVRVQARCFIHEDSGEIFEGRRKEPYPEVIDYPVFDPAEISGPMVTEGEQVITAVRGANVTIEAVADQGKYHVYLDENSLDANPKEDAIYRLERPIFVNVSQSPTATPQPEPLRYFRYGGVGVSTEKKFYLYSDLLTAITTAEAVGYLEGSSFTTGAANKMVKEIDAAGTASGGKGLESHLNVAHSGFPAPKLKRTQAFLAKSPQVAHYMGDRLDHPMAIRPEGVITKWY